MNVRKTEYKQGLTISLMYLICDPGYAVLSAFSNGGDLYLVNKALGKRAYMTKIISVLLLMINISLFIIMIHKYVR